MVEKSKTFVNFILFLSVIICFLFGVFPMPAEAQDIQTNKTVDDLKKEILHRSSINLYPVFGIPRNIMEETIKDIKTLKVDEWAEAFISSGDKYYNLGIKNAKNNELLAIKNYEIAQRLYNMGRWPAVTTSSRNTAYARERKAFEAVHRLNGTKMDIVTIIFNKKTVTGDLILPANSSSPVPLVISIGGLDGWKEARVTQLMPLVQHGAALLSLDMPGTGQSGVKMGAGAEESLFAIIEKTLIRADIDPERVVFYGGSFGGYWTTLLASRNRIKLKGVVDQSGPFSEAFNPDHLMSVFDGNEYLYDSFPALNNLLSGTTNKSEFLKKIKLYAIDNLVSGSLTINCPVLIIGGKHDSLVPSGDLMPVLFSDGAPRDAWINPNGIHMGRERGQNATWNDKVIYQKIIFPWVEGSKNP
ncbi:alpha/beta hydrolase family protein [Gluconobacter cerinus]|uniref:alpha/beta hydrolase family protein n=1 Tax=Gluconobacter cerinus TaxID=38307 RepID=UPI001B8CA764|nr:alpha/beta fold hydrolase [Gluconobacter cerinus]MBS1039206.1 alpha/beta hydrolase [Gluconobacter cerinus]